MKGDFAEHLEMPVMEPDDNRPAREYVSPASIRIHSILFLLIAVTVVAAMLFVLQVATSTSSVNRIAVTDGQTNGARGFESPAVARIDPATSENGSAALDGQGRTIAIVEGPAPSGGQPQELD